MKMPDWIKQYWKDPAFRYCTIFPPIVGVIWDAIISAIDQELFIGTSILMCGGVTIMYFIGYLKRNSP